MYRIFNDSIRPWFETAVLVAAPLLFGYVAMAHFNGILFR